MSFNNGVKWRKFCYMYSFSSFCCQKDSNTKYFKVKPRLLNQLRSYSMLTKSVKYQQCDMNLPKTLLCMQYRENISSKFSIHALSYRYGGPRPEEHVGGPSKYVIVRKMYLLIPKFIHTSKILIAKISIATQSLI